jgi:hypothetical protein
MSRLLEAVDAGALMHHLPADVRTSLETLERAGTDWNAVGSLLAGTPTAGVAVAGNGQWTADLWEAVKWEFRSFLCTDSERYAELRAQWDEVARRSPASAVGALAAAVGARLGVAGGVVAPLVTWLLVVARRAGAEDVCLTLSASPSHVALVQPREPRAPFA